jgi:hypothetical protein
LVFEAWGWGKVTLEMPGRRLSDKASVSSPNLSICQIKQQQICPAAAVAYFSQKLTFSQIDAAHFG